MESAIKKAQKNEIDMTKGKLFEKIVAFAVPLMLTGVLQLLFNSADIIVVGQWVGNDATGAVGSNGALINLVIGLFLGLSGGSGVVLAEAYGAKDAEYGEKVLHSAMLFGVISGIFIGIVGFFLSETLLIAMSTPSELLDMAALYLKIYFLGAPFNLVYNFGASMLRATGDTKRPLLYLFIAGIINIIVNIITVAAFGWGVAGVAIATVLSQAISAVLIVITLLKSRGFVKLSLKKLKFSKKATLAIIKYGVPTGIQSSLFSLSNVLVQTAVNGFGNTGSTGSAVEGQIGGYVYTIFNSVSITVLTAVGQNYGAKDFERIKRSVWQCLAFSVAVSIVCGWLAILFRYPLASLFINVNEEDSENVSKILQFMTEKMFIDCGLYFLCGAMEIMSHAMRAIGASVESMIIVLVGSCILRIVWIYLVFPYLPHTFMSLFIIYPITWLLTFAVTAAVLVSLFKKRKKQLELESALLEADKTAA